MYIYVILEHLLGKYGHCNDYYGWMDSERMGITLRTKKKIYSALGICFLSLTIGGSH